MIVLNSVQAVNLWVSIKKKKIKKKNSTKNKKTVCTNNIQINGVNIEKLETTKFLGVYLDSKLNWSHHINYIKGKVAGAIGVVSKARKFLSRQTLLTLYHTFVYPYLQYCVEVWGCTSKTYLLPLIRLQQKIVRILSFSKRKAHTEVLFTGLKILHLGQIYTCKVMIFMYKYVQQLLPNVFLDMFCRSYEVHQYNTRYLDLFREPSFKTDLRRRTIRYTGVHLYNSFKPKIDFNCSLVTFKYHLKELLFTTEVNG